MLKTVPKPRSVISAVTTITPNGNVTKKPINTGGSKLKRSDIYNKETLSLVQLDPQLVNKRKKDFFKSYHRNRNLKLATALENSAYSGNESINKIISALRFCTSLSLLEKDVTGEESIHSSSKTCKSSHCSICSRRRSAKLSNRLLSAILDKGNENKFKGKYFYFMTLTLKHNVDVRSGIYIKDLKQSMKKLYKSKVFLKYFGYDLTANYCNLKTRKMTYKKNWFGGWFEKIEMTLADDGYHIHAHFFLTGKRLKEKVLKYEKELRNEWLNITGDSTGVQFDLIKMKVINDSKGNLELKSPEILKPIMEVFKYTSKSGAIANLSPDAIDSLALWMLATKGKNFITSHGCFRGLNITGTKCKYDTVLPPKVYDVNSSFRLGKTSQLLFNHSTRVEYSKDQRERIINKVYIRHVQNNFMDVSLIIGDVLDLLKASYTDAEIDLYLKWIIDKMHDRARQDLEAAALFQLSEEEKKKAVKRMLVQMKLL